MRFGATPIDEMKEIMLTECDRCKHQRILHQVYWTDCKRTEPCEHHSCDCKLFKLPRK